MMNFDVQTLESDLHRLDCRFGSLRIQQSRVVDRLTRSIEQNGQLVPLVAVAEQSDHWVLIDGYQRIEALRRLSRDTARIELWDCPLSQALLIILVRAVLQIDRRGDKRQRIHHEFGVMVDAGSDCSLQSYCTYSIRGGRKKTPYPPCNFFNHAFLHGVILEYFCCTYPVNLQAIAIMRKNRLEYQAFDSMPFYSSSL